MRPSVSDSPCDCLQKRGKVWQALPFQTASVTFVTPSNLSEQILFAQRRISLSLYDRFI